MYRHYFRLNELPFALTPDTSFAFNSVGMRQGRQVLDVALGSGEGFVKVTGEVGTGKTLLCRRLINELGEGYVTVAIHNPMLEPDDLYLTLAQELGVNRQPGESFPELVRRLSQRLLHLVESGRQVVLLVDEAQSLPPETLEALRLMTNLETEKRKVLQVVLVGQPELDRRLARSEHRQLLQRITFSHTLLPLTREEVEGYVNHRLVVAGHNGPPLFTPRALAKLSQVSRGYPRLINVLAHKAMMAAYGEGKKRVEREHVELAVADTESVTPVSWGWRRVMALAWSVPLVVGVATLLGR